MACFTTYCKEVEAAQVWLGILLTQSHVDKVCGWLLQAAMLLRISTSLWRSTACVLLKSATSTIRCWGILGARRCPAQTSLVCSAARVALVHSQDIFGAGSHQHRVSQLGRKDTADASWVRRSLTLRPRMMPTATTWPATRQTLSQEEASASIFSSSSMTAILAENVAKAYLQRTVLGKQACFAVRKPGAQKKLLVQSTASTTGAQEMTGSAVEVSPIVPRYNTSVAVKPAGSPVLRPESFPCSLSPGLASLLALGVRPKRPAARKMVVDATTICKYRAVMPAALHKDVQWCWA